MLRSGASQPARLLMRSLFGFLLVCALGLVPLAGCAEDTSAAGTGGTGGTSKGACTNPNDLAMVCAWEFVDWAWNCGSQTLGRCSPGTGGDAEDTFECQAEIASECLQDDDGMSEGCGDCFGDTIACVLANCESCVFGPHTPKCHICRAEYCYPTLYECSGDIVAGCDGDLWCQRVDCDDFVDCTENVCIPAEGVCSYSAIADGAQCAGGTCRSGACAVSGSVLPCTEQGLRNAVAAGGGPYTFDCDGPTRVVTQAEIVMNKDVILDGGGDMTVDGNELHRVFTIAAEAMVELSGFAITGGGGTDDGKDFLEGGAIANHGTLVITDSAVWENGRGEDSFGVRGGGVFNDGTLTLTDTALSANTGGGGGAIWNAGVLMMTDTTVSENAADEGGGIYNAAAGTLTLTNSEVWNNTAGGAGGIFNRGTLLITESTVWGNIADEHGGGILNRGTIALTNADVSHNWAGEDGAGIFSAGAPASLTLINCTVSGNSAGDVGGGIHNDGLMTLTNSTVSGNEASLAGGILNDGMSMLIGSTVSWNNALVLGGIGNDRDASLTVSSSTVSGNTAEFFAGSIFNDGAMTITNSTVSGDTTEFLVSGILNAGMLTVTNSLVASDCSDDAGITSNGYNIESPGNTCGFDQQGDQVNVTEVGLNLEPLAGNGGPTETHALGDGSLAINQIPEVACEEDTDQRGESRPEPGGSMCDVGSFEVQPAR